MHGTVHFGNTVRTFYLCQTIMAQNYSGKAAT